MGRVGVVVLCLHALCEELRERKGGGWGGCGDGEEEEEEG